MVDTQAGLYRYEDELKTKLAQGEPLYGDAGSALLHHVCRKLSDAEHAELMHIINVSNAACGVICSNFRCNLRGQCVEALVTAVREYNDRQAATKTESHAAA